jgi:hypothetical protein
METKAELVDTKAELTQKNEAFNKLAAKFAVLSIKIEALEAVPDVQPSEYDGSPIYMFLRLLTASRPSVAIRQVVKREPCTLNKNKCDREHSCGFCDRIGDCVRLMCRNYYKPASFCGKDCERAHEEDGVLGVMSKESYDLSRANPAFVS